jgi:hypothetical protein
MSVVDDVKKHSAEYELAGVDFLDEKGHIGARGKAVTDVRLKFIDGRRFTLTILQFNEIGDHHFQLRPVRDDA